MLLGEGFWRVGEKVEVSGGDEGGDGAGACADFVAGETVAENLSRMGTE